MIIGNFGLSRGTLYRFERKINCLTGVLYLSKSDWTESLASGLQNVGQLHVQGVTKVRRQNLE